MNAGAELDRHHIITVCLATVPATPRIGITPANTPGEVSGPVAGGASDGPWLTLAYEGLTQCHRAKIALNHCGYATTTGLLNNGRLYGIQVVGWSTGKLERRSAYLREAAASVGTDAALQETTERAIEAAAQLPLDADRRTAGYHVAVEITEQMARAAVEEAGPFAPLTRFPSDPHLRDLLRTVQTRADRMATIISEPDHPTTRASAEESPMTTTPNTTGTVYTAGAAYTADTPTAVGAVDAEHVAEVCRLAASAMPYATRYSARAIGEHVDGSGVTVVAVSPRIRRTVAHALRRHGYQLAHVPPEMPPEVMPEDPATAPMRPTTGRMAGLAVRVTGWSPSGLARRVEVLSRTVADLERSLPATIAQTVRAYALLHDDLDPTIALYGTADAIRAGLQAQIARRAGPLPRHYPSTRGLPEPARQHLADINDLTQQVTDLLALHWTVAVRAAVRYSELAHRHAPATAQAKAITETYTTIQRQHRTDLFLDARTTPSGGTT